MASIQRGRVAALSLFTLSGPAGDRRGRPALEVIGVRHDREAALRALAQRF